MAKKTAAENADKNRRKAARKAERSADRAKNIERRKGLGEGEGAKVLENRKARRRELFKDPEAGKFTKKYKGEAAAGNKAGFDNYVSNAEQQKAGVDKFKQGLSQALKPKDGPMSGGGFSITGEPGADRHSITGNAGSAFMKKKGY